VLLVLPLELPDIFTRTAAVPAALPVVSPGKSRLCADAGAPPACQRGLKAGYIISRPARSCQ
jgi:hypothetical protein